MRTPNVSFDRFGFVEHSRVKIMNIVCITSAVLAVLSGIVGSDSRPYLFSLFSLAGVFIITLILNNFVRRLKLAEYFVTFATTGWIVFMCVAFPSSLGEQNYLIIALVALAIFSDKKIYQAVTIIVLIGLTVCLNLYQRFYPPMFSAPEAADFLFAVNVIMPLAIIAVMCLQVLKHAVASQTVIETQREQLAESNQFKDKVFSIIGHDMRSPFNSTIGLLDLLEAGMLSEEEWREATKELKQNINTSLQTLDNILGWASQGYYGSIMNAKINKQKLNLYNLIVGTMEFLKSTATQKNVSFKNQVPPDVYVFGDYQQVSFILRNITSNAVKFSHAQQTITFDAVMQEQDVIIAVSDEGVGMTDEMISSLFKINTRFSKEGTTQEKGTGLGLIFCKEFVENNNGRLWVESYLNKGTTVNFSLPLYEIHQAESLKAHAL